MFLSIVIPVWNDEKFLNECLDSCLEQDLSKEEYEIICVDDGSTDRTPEILRDYAEKYPNIRIITKQHGVQFGRGRVIGCESAAGDFLWLVDHDDVMAPHAVDELKRIVGEHPDYDRYAFPYYRFQTAFTQEERELFQSGGLPSVCGIRGNSYYPWSSILRLSFLREHGISPHSNQISEAGSFWGIEPFYMWGTDWVMLNECYENGARTYQIQGRPLYHYRIHAGQSISIADPETVKNRAVKRRNTVLFRGYRAWFQKQRYLELEKTDPAAAEKAVTDAIVRLRDIVSYASSMVEDWAWQDCVRRFREKNIFFSHKPRLYRFSLWNYLKNISLRERFLPRTILSYYSFTVPAAKLCYRINKQKREKEAKRIQTLAEERASLTGNPDSAASS